MHAALQAEHPHMVIVPMAVAYDLVLEDHVLARQRVKRAQRPFSRELAEMVRYAVGYRSRAFVTFGKPIPVDGIDPKSRRAVLDLGHTVMDAIGRRLQGAADSGGRRGDAAVDHAARARAARRRAHRHAARRRREPRRAPAAPRQSTPPSSRSKPAASSSSNRGRVRVRDRNVLRYYARTIEHLLDSPSTPDPLVHVRRPRPERMFSLLVAQRPLKRLASRYGMAPEQLRPAVHRRRDRRGSHRGGPRAAGAAACCVTLDYLGESVAHARGADRGDARVPASSSRPSSPRASSATSR